MSDTLRAVLEQVHQLNKSEQLVLIELMVRMIRESEGEDAQLSPEWEAELNKRDALLDAGNLPLFTFEEAKKRIINRNKTA